ncbi:MAG: hypothetical protein ACK5MD_09655 [Flavobacteriales bacterium]
MSFTIFILFFTSRQINRLLKDTQISGIKWIMISLILFLVISFGLGIVFGVILWVLNKEPLLDNSRINYVIFIISMLISLVIHYKDLEEIENIGKIINYK